MRKRPERDYLVLTHGCEDGEVGKHELDVRAPSPRDAAARARAFLKAEGIKPVARRGYPIVTAI